MAQRSARSETSTPELQEDTSTSSDNQKRRTSNVEKKDSIKNYVTNVLHRHGRDEQQPTDLSRAEIKIETVPTTRSDYENISAFRQYRSNAEGTTRTNAQRRQDEDSTTEDDEDEDLRNRFSRRQPEDEDGSMAELNLDPNPILQERESAEQIYKQKVYLRQLQPPTPQPIEIQVQEVLIKSEAQKPPIHVRVGQPEPRTPSPVVIKSSPPQPPPVQPDQPIIYNKYLPPPKQPPRQIIIHRFPELPPKPRPIVVEQWLPYKPAPKRIIKHTLPREALQTPPPPHNLIVSYAKPRALIQVELVRLPVVKIDPYTYQQMSTNNPQQLAQYPSFQHEQDYLGRNNRSTQPPTNIDWRI